MSQGSLWDNSVDKISDIMLGMANIRIAVINQSTVVADETVQPVVSVLQTQVSRDFSHVWGIDAELMFIPRGSTPPADAWWLVILDDTDQATALGYHEKTDQGQPLGKVFARTSLNSGFQWTLTASHELLEMLADPAGNLTVFVQQRVIMGMLYAYEVCDPCQSPNYAYTIDGIQVSDFVFPSWFESFWKAGSTQFDYMNAISAPFQILPGGYISSFKIYLGSGWRSQNSMATSAEKTHQTGQLLDSHETTRIKPQSTRRKSKKPIKKKNTDSKIKK